MLKKRIDDYDITKGIGILLVILGHNTPTGNFKMFIYSFHMPLFLFVSGLLLKSFEKNITLRENLRKEKTLIANYLFYSVVYFIFDAFFRIAILHQANIHLLFWDGYETITLFGINVLWFVSSLFLTRLLVRWIISKFTSTLCYWLFIIVFFSVGILGNMWFPNENHVFGVYKLLYYPGVSIARTFVMAGFVLLGFVLKKLVKSYIVFSSKKTISLLLGMLLFANIILSRFTGNIDYHYVILGNIGLTYILGITGSLSVIGISHCLVDSKYVSRELIIWGKNSLFVMVTHEYLLLSSVLKGVAELLTSSTILQIIIINIGLIVIERILIAVLATKLEHLVDLIKVKFIDRLIN